jgi:hypothetical protein
MSKNMLLMYWPSRKTLHGYLTLARISNSPTVVSNTLAGTTLAGQLGHDVRISFIALAMLAFYTAGMYLNDVMDYAIDCQGRPERPLPSGTISRSVAVVATIFLFGIGGSILLLFVNLGAFLAGLILIALIVLYDAWHKSNPLSPLLMATARFMIYVTGFFAFFSFSSPLERSLFPLFLPGGLLFLYVVGLTYIAKGETEERRRSNAGILIAVFLPSAYFILTAQSSLLALPFMILFTSWIIYSVSFTFRSMKKQVGRTVGQLIAGISLLDCMILAAAGNVVGLALSFGAFGLTLSLQHYIKGT